MILTINDKLFRGISNREDLLALLESNAGPDAGIWLALNSDPDGELPYLCGLKQEQSCHLQYMTTRAGLRRFYSYQADAIRSLRNVTFQLANGDATYSTNCVPLHDACAAMIYFLETNGSRSTWINWQQN